MYDASLEALVVSLGDWDREILVIGIVHTRSSLLKNVHMMRTLCTTVVNESGQRYVVGIKIRLTQCIFPEVWSSKARHTLLRVGPQAMRSPKHVSFREVRGLNSDRRSAR